MRLDCQKASDIHASASRGVLHRTHFVPLGIAEANHRPDGGNFHRRQQNRAAMFRDRRSNRRNIGHGNCAFIAAKAGTRERFLALLQRTTNAGIGVSSCGDQEKTRRASGLEAPAEYP